MDNNKSNIVSDVRVFYDPNKFLKFRERNQNIIKSSKIIPPKLGDKTFGSIEVRLKTPNPIYKDIFDKATNK